MKFHSEQIINQNTQGKSNKNAKKNKKKCLKMLNDAKLLETMQKNNQNVKFIF